MGSRGPQKNEQPNAEKGYYWVPQEHVGGKEMMAPRLMKHTTANRRGYKPVKEGGSGNVHNPIAQDRAIDPVEDLENNSKRMHKHKLIDETKSNIKHPVGEVHGEDRDLSAHLDEVAIREHKRLGDPSDRQVPWFDKFGLNAKLNTFVPLKSGSYAEADEFTHDKLGTIYLIDIGPGTFLFHAPKFNLTQKFAKRENAAKFAEKFVEDKLKGDITQKIFNFINKATILYKAEELQNAVFANYKSGNNNIELSGREGQYTIKANNEEILSTNDFDSALRRYYQQIKNLSEQNSENSDISLDILGDKVIQMNREALAKLAQLGSDKEVEKYKVYIGETEKVPVGVALKEGPRGAKYYETNAALASAQENKVEDWKDVANPERDFKIKPTSYKTLEGIMGITKEDVINYYMQKETFLDSHNHPIREGANVIRAKLVPMFNFLDFYVRMANNTSNISDAELNTISKDMGKRLSNTQLRDLSPKVFSMARKIEYILKNEGSQRMDKIVAIDQFVALTHQYEPNLIPHLYGIERGLRIPLQGYIIQILDYMSGKDKLNKSFQIIKKMNRLILQKEVSQVGIVAGTQESDDVNQGVQETGNKPGRDDKNFKYIESDKQPGYRQSEQENSEPYFKDRDWEPENREIDKFQKEKIYIAEESDAPKGYNTSRGPRGGIYYDTENRARRAPLGGRNVASSNNPTEVKKEKITKELAKEVGDKLGIDFNKIDFSQFYVGINVELEHGTKDLETNITNDNLLLTGKIAWIHIKEVPDYYTKLETQVDPEYVNLLKSNKLKKEEGMVSYIPEEASSKRDIEQPEKVSPSYKAHESKQDPIKFDNSMDGDEPEFYLKSEDIYDLLDKDYFVKMGVKYDPNQALPLGARTIGRDIEKNLYHNLRNSVDNWYMQLTDKSALDQARVDLKASLLKWQADSNASMSNDLQKLFEKGIAAGVRQSGVNVDQKAIENINTQINQPRIGLIPALEHFQNQLHGKLSRALVKNYDFETNTLDIKKADEEITQIMIDQRYRTQLMVKSEVAAISNYGMLKAWDYDGEKDNYRYYWKAIVDNRIKPISLVRKQGNPYSYNEITFLWKNQEQVINGKWMNDKFFQRAVDGETKVWVLSGKKKIKDIKVGDIVLSMNEESKELQTSKIIGNYLREENDYYIEIVYETNKDGMVIRSTKEHPFLTTNGWVEAENLQPGMELFYFPYGKKHGFNPNIDKQKIVDCLKKGVIKYWKNPANRLKQSIEVKNRYANEEYLKNHKEKVSLEWANNFERRKKASEKEHLDNRFLRFKRNNPEKYKELCLERSKRQKIKMSNLDFVGQIGSKIAKSLGIKPNNVEIKLYNTLQEHFPNDWKYVGDGSLWIGGKNPDFVSKNEQKVIEMFGDYWHKGENPEDRIEHFKKYGYDCLVFWENEVIKHPEIIKTKVLGLKLENGKKILSVNKRKITKYRRFYDLQCSPNHNFIIQGGIVVHNCGIARGNFKLDYNWKKNRFLGKEAEFKETI